MMRKDDADAVSRLDEGKKIISPFPGMDPYIEACGLWGDFHSHLIEKIAEALAALAPERYLIRTGERSYVAFAESGGETKKAGTALAEPVGDADPVTMRAFVREEHRETFVEIHEASAGQRLVTSIEVLSPSNKRPGTEGWKLYQRKRQSLLLGDMSLLEIDLLQGGQRMPMVDPWPDSPYTLLVARAGASVCRVWRAHYRRALPVAPVPLAKPDADIPLDLQPMIDDLYQRFQYARSIDHGKPLTPPLDAADANWLEQQLRAGRRRQSGT